MPAIKSKVNGLHVAYAIQLRKTKMDGIKEKDRLDAIINPTASDILLPQSSPLGSHPPAVFFLQAGRKHN